MVCACMCEGVCEGVCMCEVCYEFNYAICTMSKGPDAAKFVSSWKANICVPKVQYMQRKCYI